VKQSYGCRIRLDFFNFYSFLLFFIYTSLSSFIFFRVIWPGLASRPFPKLLSASWFIIFLFVLFLFFSAGRVLVCAELCDRWGWPGGYFVNWTPPAEKKTIKWRLKISGET
jgi:hypothetical protein